MLSNEFDAQYYLNKIDAGDHLTERECLNMAYYFDIANEYGENRRWSRWVRTICNLNGRYFAVEWDQGLTEMQDDSCFDQPYEVELHEYDIVQHVKEWVAKNKGDTK